MGFGFQMGQILWDFMCEISSHIVRYGMYVNLSFRRGVSEKTLDCFSTSKVAVSSTAEAVWLGSTLFECFGRITLQENHIVVIFFGCPNFFEFDNDQWVHHKDEELLKEDHHSGPSHCQGKY